MSQQQPETVFQLLTQFQLTLVTFVTCTLVIGLLKLRKCYSFWENQGFKGPKPWPLVGNIVELLFKNRFEVQKEWQKKYGKVYGTFFGLKPKLIIADPESIVQVSIKDFDVFPNHDNEASFQGKYIKSFIFNKTDDEWKRVRCLLSLTFTSGKIKRMFKLLDGCADDLVQACREQLQGKEGTILNIKDSFNLYTLDGILTCCYNLKLNRAGSSNLKTLATRDKVVEAALLVFKINFWRFATTLIAPKGLLNAINFHMVSEKNYQPIADMMASIIKKRTQMDGPKPNDYLQLLLEAKADAPAELDEYDSEENHHANLTNEAFQEEQRKFAGELGAKLELTEMEVLSSAMFIAAVGLETTSSLLTSCTYALSFHPEIQDQLYGELMKFGQEREGTVSFDYESLTSCKYLDAVISETLRMFPPAVTTERQAKRDYTLEKYKVTIPRGTKVELAIRAVHHDPDFWPEPDKFRPERFLPGNKDKIVPGSYCPFGIGPRHCLGMRFSLTEAKLGLARLVTSFRFKPAPEATFPPEPKIPIILFQLKVPKVILVPRQ